MKEEGSTPIVITTVVPTYNHENYIGECVRSIVRQRMRPGWHHHVVVGDDGSSDKTQKILDEIVVDHPQVSMTILKGDPANRTGRFRFNGRVVGRENIRALMNYPGDFMAFCEGDDLWLEDDKLIRQVEFLMSNDDYSICWSQAKLIDDEGNDLGQTEIAEELRFEDLMYDFPVGHSCCSALWRSDRFDRDLYDRTENQMTGNDTIWLNLLLAGKGKVLNSVLIARRIHGGGGWSGEDPILREAGKLMLFNNHGNIFGDVRFPSESLRAALLDQGEHIKTIIIDEMSAEQLLEEWYKKFSKSSRKDRVHFWQKRFKNQIKKMLTSFSK